MTARGGGVPSGMWARGGLSTGLPSRPGSTSSVAPHSSSSSASASSSSGPPQQPVASTLAFGGRGSSRGGSSAGDRGGRGSGNALSRMEALGDEGDAKAGEDPASLDSEGLVMGGEEDDEGKAHARSQRFNKKFEGNQFEKLHVLRERERKQAIAHGDIDDPDNPNAPKRIGSLKGTCEEMCPTYEREEREHKFNVDRLELLAGTTNRIDHSKAVKMFHRPAAGNEQALPSDVRTPETLRNTLNYLFGTLLGEDPDLKATHSFIRDRTRSIRQDFSVQSDKSDISIECHERMARYHIHALHVLCANEGFSVQQEMEQMKKVFQSLDQFYTDRRTSRLYSSDTPSSPHEAEFCAYLLLAHIWDTDILRKTESLPPYLFYTPEVQLALSLAYMAQRSNDPHSGRSKPTSELSQNFFTRFFKTVQRGTTPYLVACLVESHFGDVRKAGLLGLKKSLIKRYGTVSAEDLVGMLGCDDVRDVAEICMEFGLQVTYEGAMPVSVEINRDAVIVDPRQNYAQRHSHRVVDSKRSGWSNTEIINGQAVRRRANSPVESRAAPSRPPPAMTATKSKLSGSASSFQPRPSPLGTTQPFGASSSFGSFPSSSAIPSSQSPAPLLSSSNATSPLPPVQRKPFLSPFGFSSAPAPPPTSSSSVNLSATPFVPRAVPASTSTFTSPSATPKQPPPPPLKPKQRPHIPSPTITELASTLLEEAVTVSVANVSSAAVVAQQTFLAQQEANRALGLAQWLDGASASFAQDALDDRIDVRVELVSREVLADEQGRRWTERRVLRKLREVGKLRKMRREHLEKRRRDEEGMGLSMSRVTVEYEDYETDSGEESDLEAERIGASKRAVPGDYKARDAELAQNGVRSAKLYAPGTFLDTLTDHLSSLVPPPPIDEDLLPWDVLLSTEIGVTSTHLRRKLDMENEAIVARRTGRSVEVRVGDEEDMMDSEHIGLIIFEVGHDSSKSSWSPEDDVIRLQDALEVISEDNFVATSLLLVSWASPDLDEEIAEALDLENVAIPLSRIRFAHLNAVDGDIDTPFSSSLKQLVRSIGTIKLRTVLPEAYIAPLEPVWEDLLAFGIDVLALEPTYWPTVISTVNQLIMALNDLSSSVVRALGVPKLASGLALPPFAAANEITDNRSASLALQNYLSLSRFEGDFAFDLVRCDLRDARCAGTPPPYRALLENLFESLVSRLSLLPPVRLSSLKDDDTPAVFQDNCEEVEKGFQAVLDEHRMQQALRRQEEENERKTLLTANVMLVDVVVSTPGKVGRGGKRPREEEPIRADQQRGGFETPLQRLKRSNAEVRESLGL